MKIWLIRHPKPLIADGICYGQSDIEAEPDALAISAQILSKLIPLNIPVFTSPLLRAYALAQRLAVLRQDLIVTCDDRLKEMAFGCWEKTAWSDIPRSAIDDWVQDFSIHRFGGIESAQDVVNRVGQLLEEKKLFPEIVLITHAGVIKAARFLNVSTTGQLHDARDWPKIATEYGGYEVLDF